MSNLRITGRRPLSGEVAISGRKNSAIKLIAASLLSDQPVTLRRLPDIADVHTMLQILEGLGGRVERQGEECITISTAGVTGHDIPSELGRKLRASLVFVGPLLARFGQVSFPHPGGCVIGKRSIDPHLDAFRQLGARVEFDGTTYRLTVGGPHLTGRDVYLSERTVTGTENVVMAAVRASGTTRVFNAAEERHIVNLCELLRRMGYTVEGDGTSTITVHGDPAATTREAEVTVIPDEIETGTFAVAAAVTGGDVTLRQVGGRLDLFPLLGKLSEFNVQYQYREEDEVLRILPSPDLRAATVKVSPWPGFPPDLQSPFTVLATQAKGTSLIHDWMYEGRLYFVDLLQRMGANIVTCDPHRALVSGPTELYHSSLISPDLRAGAALVLAALAAEGTSVVEHAELIDRGYVRIEERLRQLGAEISREG